MTSTSKLWVAMIVVAIMALGGYFYPQIQQATSNLLGSTGCGSITCLSGGLRLVTDAGGDFEADVASVFGGTAAFNAAATFNSTVNITTTNVATSTLVVGCVQTYATSTATPIRFVIGSAQLASTTFGGTTSNGAVLWQYGTCPH